MQRHHLATTAALFCIATAAPAIAEDLSTSIMRPSPINASTATISGKLPGAEAARTYYLAADLTAGSLVTQFQISGRASGNRRLTLQLLKPDASVADLTFVRSGFGTSDERTKAFAIDSSGRYVIRLILEGEETGSYCILFGGTALPGAKPQSCGAAAAAAEALPAPAAAAAPAPAAPARAAAAAPAPRPPTAAVAPAASANELSTSILRPSPLDRASGVVSGKLPGGDTVKSYYLVADLKPGNLLAQLRVAGRAEAERRLTLQLLDAQAAVLESAFVRSGFGTSDETTKVFPIDRSGPQVLRLIVEGEETGTYCVLFGGTALGPTADQSCPAAPAAPVTSAQIPAAPAPKPLEVVVDKCEERLRVGADFLFDFNRADLRAEATPALDALVQHIAVTDETVMVEGHTDAIGTDAYNLGLSERRAASVRNSLVDRGLRATQLVVRGFGKARPIAPNQRPDGSDDPDGRQQNRRVEVVIHTCE